MLVHACSTVCTAFASDMPAFVFDLTARAMSWACLDVGSFRLGFWHIALNLMVAGWIVCWSVRVRHPAMISMSVAIPTDNRTSRWLSCHCKACDLKYKCQGLLQQQLLRKRLYSAVKCPSALLAVCLNPVCLL
jgi:hypothetical protein